MTAKIHLARNLVLPPATVTQKIAMMGQTGSGKTYATGKLVEEMLRAKMQVIILDPVGIWWGLRLAADGKRKCTQVGVPEIPILGGDHGDVPLEPTAGKLVADLATGEGLSMVVDVSNWLPSEMKGFVTAFTERFYQQQKKRRTAVHIVLEEAQEFIPEQTPKGQGLERMKGALLRMIKIGRNCGIGATMISQRPQAVSKAALNQAGAVFCFRMTGKHERKALQEWLTSHASADDIKDAMNRVPELEDGKALLVSPGWLREYRQVAIGTKRTYDASATPEHGVEAVPPRTLKRGELKALTKAMGDAVDKAKAADPALLRKTIARLEADLEAAPTTERQEEMADRIQALERVIRESKPPEIGMTVKEATSLLGIVRAAQTDLEHAVTQLSKAIGDRLQAAVDRIEAIQTRRPPPIEMPPAHRSSQAERHGRAILGRVRQVAARLTDLPPDLVIAEEDIVLNRKVEREILKVLNQHPEGRELRALGILAGYSINGGGFKNGIRRLRTLGLLEGVGSGLYTSTPLGRHHLPVDPLPRSPEALLAHWMAQMERRAEREVLGYLVRIHPQRATPAAVAEGTGYSPDGGGFKNAIRKLRTLQLISGSTELEASEDLK